MELLIVAALLGLIPAAIAQGKGRSFWLWWLYGAALFIVAIVHALLMSPDRAALERKQIGAGMKKCPHCAEIIKTDARVCRYCGRDVPTQSESSEMRGSNQGGPAATTAPLSSANADTANPLPLILLGAAVVIFAIWASMSGVTGRSRVESSETEASGAMRRELAARINVAGYKCAEATAVTDEGFGSFGRVSRVSCNPDGQYRIIVASTGATVSVELLD